MRSTLFLTLLLLASLCAHAQHSFQKLDVNPLGGSKPSHFASFKGKTYFWANDGVHGNELWWTDGQSFGMVADITPGPGSTLDEKLYQLSPDANNFAVVNDKLFFRARDPQWGGELFEYDGINAPVMAEPLDVDTFNRRYCLTEMNGLLYFIGGRGYTSGLYSYDPVARTYKFCMKAMYLNSVVRFGDKLALLEDLFMAVDSRLYIYDPATEKADTLAEGTSGMGNEIGNLYVYKESLYFVMATPPYGAALFRYDGSTLWRATGTAPGDPRGFGRFAGMGDKLYFMAADSAAPLADLYSYNVVTEKVTVEQPMASNRAAYDLVVYGRKLFLAADRYNNFEKGIFQYDGVNLNLLSFPGQPYSDVPVWLAESNGKLFFSGQEGVTPGDMEAWVYVDSVALGVNEVNPRPSATVFPNPATSEAVISIKLQHASTLIVQLADIQGRVVYYVTTQLSAGKQEIIVPVKELPAAVYTYKLTDAAGTVLGMGKLVKE